MVNKIITYCYGSKYLKLRFNSGIKLVKFKHSDVYDPSKKLAAHVLLIGGIAKENNLGPSVCELLLAHT